MTAPILKDRYQLIAKAGEGRFAVTYFARDLETARDCVVKQLSFRSLSEWKELELFEREAQTLSHLTHARIPRFIDFFKFEDEDGMQICSVQEYIQGRTLAQLIDAERPFTETEILRIGTELAKILEYLHGFSPPVVHRDIKPSNVLLNESGDVYLIDFGCVVAHALGEQERGSTIVGTYGYMPPEQFAGQPMPASGSLANLDGRLEFERPNHVSPQLARVLRKMVQREPRKRLRSGVEVRLALERVAGGRTDPTVSRRLFSTAAGLGVVLGVAAALFSPMIRQAPGTASTVREPKSIVDVPLPTPAPRYTALARPPTSEPTCVLTGSVPSHAEVFGDFKLLPSGLRAEARRRAGAVGSAPGRPGEEWAPLGFTPLGLAARRPYLVLSAGLQRSGMGLERPGG